MAKTPKAKKKAISIHSRAARRAGSPTVNIGNVTADKSSASQSTTYTPHHVSNEASRGIRKRKSALSRNQKLRRKRGVERADATTAKVEIKKQKSMSKLKTVKERAKDWEDVNSKGKKNMSSATNGFSALAGMDDEGASRGVEQILAIRKADEAHSSTTADEQHMDEQMAADDDI